MSIEALKAALAALDDGPVWVPPFTMSDDYPLHLSDSQGFKAFEMLPSAERLGRFFAACDPDTIRALLKDAERYRRWREGFTSTEVDPLLDMLQRHAWTPDEVDSFIDAAMGEQA